MFVNITVQRFHRYRDIPRAFVSGLRLRRHWAELDGAVGLWLWSQYSRRRSGSVSVWLEEEDLRCFVRWPVHVEIMRRFRPVSDVTTTSWWVERFEPALVWEQAVSHLTGDGSARPVG